MHELSIAMGILELTEEESEKRGGVHVDAIHVRLGPLSGVVKEALLSACYAKTDTDKHGLLALARTWTQAALQERESASRSQ